MPNIQTILDKINRSIVDHTDIQRVVDILQRGFLSKPDGGPAVAEFQKLMAKLHGNKYAFAVNSGTSALHCAIVALTLQKDDEIIVPALANIADASVVVQGGDRDVISRADNNLTGTEIGTDAFHCTRSGGLGHCQKLGTRYCGKPIP